MKNWPSILDERETRWVWILLGGVTLFRLWYCTYNDLVGDEAYYWLWSRHLDASYYSKGPAVAWTIALGTHIFGNTVFGVRWLSVFLSLGTGWQLFLLARRLYSPVIGLWVVVVAAITPLFAVGSIIMTIDPLSVFFWVWSANLFLDAVETAPVWRWVLVGFGVGSGFLAKYTNGLELISFLFVLLGSSPDRRVLLRSKFLISLATFLLMAAPVIWWNHHHHWITAEHLKEGGHLDQKLQFSLGEFAKFLEGQALVISPFILMGILIAVIGQTKNARNWPELYLLSLFWPIFGLYALLSFHEAALPNWPALAYFGGLILAVQYWHARAKRGWARAYCQVTLVMALLMTALFHETRPLHGLLHKDPLMRARGWKDWGEKAQGYRDRFHPDYLMANDYATASELAFYLPDQPQTYIPNIGRIQNQFSLWPPYSPEPGKTVLYITDDPIETLPGLLSTEFSQARRVGKYERSYQGLHIADYWVWVLSN